MLTYVQSHNYFNLDNWLWKVIDNTTNVSCQAIDMINLSGIS